LKKIFDKQDKLVLIGIASYFVALVTIAINTNGTCDSGDSITHFLFSKYAFQHPENFLNHWAKPLFVLLSSPFAQFGFVGIKLFNCIVAAATAWFTYQTAKKINYKNAWLATVFICFTPGYFTHIFSGLTEPLFALISILGIYYLLSDRIYLAVCVISFLPFVRSEGLIIIGIFAFYLIANKQYRYLPWLLLGHVVYSIAGFFYYHDLLWVITKIPYAASSGKYGSGNLSHFIIQLNYIIGVPLYCLLGLGFVKKIKLFFSQKEIYFTVENILIYILFIAFITAHTLFWYYGIFESMGLNRVLVSIVPLAAIIALNGINFISEIIKQKFISKIVFILFTGFVILFPFIPNPASVNWKKDLSLSTDEILIADAAQYIQANFPKNTFMYYTHSYMSLVMDRDPFDKKQNRELKNFIIDKHPSHYLIIWDNWFSVVENGVSLEQLKTDDKLKLLKTYQTKTNGVTNEVIVFEGK
jgi:hypothetical protein